MAPDNSGSGPASGEAFVTSPQQRRAHFLSRHPRYAALGRQWALMRLALWAEPAEMERALTQLTTDEIFKVALVKPEGHRYPYQMLREDSPCAWRIVEPEPGAAAVETALAIARAPLAADEPRIGLIALRESEANWLLLVRGAATHFDIGTAFEFAARLSDGSRSEPVSYVDVADAIDELVADGPDPAAIHLDDAAREWTPKAHALPSSLADDVAALAARMDLSFDAALLSLWTRVVLTQGTRDGASFVAVDARGDDLEEVAGPVAFGRRFAPPDAARMGLSGVGGLAQRHLHDLRAEPFDRLGEIPMDFAFESHTLPRGARSVRLVATSCVVEPARVTLRYVERSGDRSLALVADANAVSDVMADAMGERLARLAREADLDRPLLDLPAAGPIDEQLARRINAASARAPIADDMATRLHGIAAREPHAIALDDGDRQVSYAELADMSARMATALGTGPGDVVAVSMPGDASLYIVLCAILMSGATYVPIDAATPEGRLAFMIEDSGARLLVASDDAQAATDTVARVEPETLFERAERSEPLEPRPLHPAVAAYMIYTSGTTGRPKAVVVSHAALLGYADGIAERLEIGRGTRIAALATFAADLSYTAVWGALSHAGTLVCMPASLYLDATGLADAMDRTPVDWLKIVPVHWQALIQDASGDLARRLLPRQGIVFGGDRLSPDIVAQTAALATDRPAELALVNHYGPTETTVGALTWRAAAGDREMPVGIPLAGASAHVVDTSMREVENGAIGELALGGRSLAQGYHRRADLTADRFRPARDGTPGDRVYLTGDRAWRRADGAIVFLGRNDDQIKLRGFRIEPAEVANTLRSAAGGRQVAVVADADRRGLLAFIVGPRDQIDLDAVHLAAVRELPGHAVPREIHPIRAIPLTANGKMDRAALLAFAHERSRRRITAPRSPTEARIAAIWCRILDLEQVGVDEDFFELGGHSLLATRILALIAQDLQTEISIPEFFNRPTVAQLADVVDSTDAGTALEFLTLAKRPMAIEPELSLGQERLWFLTRRGDGSHDGSHDGEDRTATSYNNAYALRLAGKLDTARFARALDAVIARHPALRMFVVERDSRAAARIAERVETPLKVDDLSHLTQSERDQAIARILAEEAASPFALDHAPLLRVRLLRLSNVETIMSLIVHHLVWDGWSNAVFTDELFERYAGIDDDRAQTDFDYFDYTYSQRRWAEGGGAAGQLDYWRNQLANLEELSLSDGAIARGEGTGTIALSLPRAVSDKLHALAVAQATTDFTVLLAIYQAALGAFTGQLDFAVGTSLANRGHTQLEPIVGYFANQVALRADLRGNPSFADFLRRVRSTVLDGMRASEVPFGLVVKAAGGARTEGRPPLFQTMLVQQHAPESRRIAGLEIDQYEAGAVRARFDATLYAGPLTGGHKATLVYDRGAIGDDAAERLCEFVVRAATLLAEEPTAPLSQLAPTRTSKPARPRFGGADRRSDPKTGSRGH